MNIGMKDYGDKLNGGSTKVTMPLASSNNLILAALCDITKALQNPSPGSPLAPVTDSHVAALKTMTDVLTGLCPNAPIAATAPPLPVPPPTASPLLRVAETITPAPPPPPSPPPTTPPQPAPTSPALRVVESPKPTKHVHFANPPTLQAPTPPMPIVPKPTYANTTGPTGRRRHRQDRQRTKTARAKAETDATAKKLQRHAARVASTKAKRTVTRAAKAATRQGTGNWGKSPGGVVSKSCTS
jgi:hypothetical protein